jgi:hypothetical protein
MRATRTALLFTICLFVHSASVLAAEGPFKFNVEVPSGKTKAIRLRNLPEKATLALQVESNGDLVVALLDASSYSRYAQNPRPLFAGRVERRLSFSVSIPAKGDYFLVLDNRPGREPRAVAVSIIAAPARKGQGGQI